MDLFVLVLKLRRFDGSCHQGNALHGFTTRLLFDLLEILLAGYDRIDHEYVRMLES